LTEFSDFECGHCANAYRSLKQVLPRYQKDVQVRFHHFPLDAACNPAVKHSVHQYACLAAMAAECAAAQGRFWEYHDMLFEHQANLDRDSLLDYAARVGLERSAFVACLDSDAPRQAIARDVAEAMRLGIESTPTFFLNGRTITGAPRATALGYAIQLERAKQRGEG
jgi:protein-disulfide isomerase